MKLSGSQKFAVPSTKVYNTLLNPDVLKACIPGAGAVSYSSPTQLRVDITLPFPGLHGPFTVFVNIPSQQAPSFVAFNVAHSGKGGKVNATTQVSLADQPNGSLLTYNATAELDGLIAVADNLIGQGIVKSKLAEFFKNLEKFVA